MSKNYWLDLNANEKQDKKKRYNRIIEEIKKEGKGEITSYLSLIDLPEIENKTISGNKTASYYGLVNSNKLTEVSAEINSKIDTKQDKLIEEGANKNLARIIIGETVKSLLGKDDIELTEHLTSRSEFISRVEDITNDIQELVKITQLQLNDEEGSGRNFSKLVLNGTPNSLLKSSKDIEINYATPTELNTAKAELQTNIDKKQDKLIDSGTGKNFGLLKVNGVGKSLVSGDVTIDTEAIDYEKAKNKPSVAGNVLEGDKYPEQLGLASKSEVEAKQDKLVDDGVGKNLAKVWVNDTKYSLINDKGEDVYISTATKEEIFNKLAIDDYYIVGQDRHGSVNGNIEVIVKVYDSNGNPVSNKQMIWGSFFGDSYQYTYYPTTDENGIAKINFNGQGDLFGKRGLHKMFCLVNDGDRNHRNAKVINIWLE